MIKTPCRHYLQGRCHEGEKCNFSHDAVPLTKSQPCRYFACHTCMKGDDCPFDHQLSKYPCNNYTTNGFCSRGSDCLFSHEIPAKQSFPVTPNVSKPELTCVKGGSSTISKFTKPEAKFPSQLNNSNSSKHTDNSGIFHQKVDAKFSSAGNSPGMSAELVGAKAVPRTTGLTPKGVSFLSNGGMSLVDRSRHKRDTSVKDNVGIDVSCKTILKMPGNVNKLSNMSDGVASRKPRGINFLSFTHPSSDGSVGEMFSDLLSNSNNEAGKSVLDDMGKGELACSLPQSVGMLKVNRQMNQSATNLVPASNEKVNGTPSRVPQHINFLNFDRISADGAILKEGGKSPSSKDETALSFVKERRNTQGDLQEATKRPSLSFDELTGQSTSGHNANLSTYFKTSLLSNTPSSVQKAVQSALSFAAKFESNIKVGSSLHQQRS
ncbi:hypothetical protein CDL12_25359 [Handroanthus impetiginosus]|uniref:C3H1-type domain-containing protein n=1 Tax=Handroanthus impetiginosus TaxID=429701 RepID=A0A2G9GA44_9LAMI|nr:hypothetical protein CDL12_25359 [Handroanthus impetiginosus]